jgi:hypothetical protein
LSDMPDFDFKKVFRRQIVEQLALHAMRGGSWKEGLANLKKNLQDDLQDIFDIEPAEVERELASLLEIRSWDTNEKQSEDAEPIDLDKVRSERAGRNPDEKRKKDKRSFKSGAGEGSYGSGVRKQVFEVVVRQAMAGAPWRSICAGPMSVNKIDPIEIEAEVRRRKGLMDKGDWHEDDDDPPRSGGGRGGSPKSPVPKNPFPFFGFAGKTRPEPGKTKGKDATARDFKSHDMKSHDLHLSDEDE